MIDLQDLSVLDILPQNLRNDLAVSAAALAIDGELQSLTAMIASLSIFSRMDVLTSDEADALAWNFHVDFYDPALPIAQRRELVKNSFRWHKRKGTPAAVEELIATVFGSGAVLEWFEYGGEPGYFRVSTSDPSATGARAVEFLAAVDSVKNVRSWLEAIEITTIAEMTLYFGHALHMGDYIICRQVV